MPSLGPPILIRLLYITLTLHDTLRKSVLNETGSDIYQIHFQAADDVQSDGDDDGGVGDADAHPIGGDAAPGDLQQLLPRHPTL